MNVYERVCQAQLASMTTCSYTILPCNQLLKSSQSPTLNKNFLSSLEVIKAMAHSTYDKNVWVAGKTVLIHVNSLLKKRN